MQQFNHYTPLKHVRVEINHPLARFDKKRKTHLFVSCLQLVSLDVIKRKTKSFPKIEFCCKSENVVVQNGRSSESLFAF